MHFLCLHGTGTNSEIFATQTVSLCYELGSAHTYEFLEGTTPTPLAEQLRAYYPASAQTYNYFEVDDTASMARGLDQLHAFIQLEGPFDGVMAYSHGAGFVATYMIQQAQLGAPPPFQCAIFFSAARPVDPTSLSTGSLRFLDAKTDQARIDIPTAHIWGSNDVLHPDTSAFVRELSNAELREDVVHEEGHDIPGGKARAAVLSMAKAIRRTVARANGWDGK